MFSVSPMFFMDDTVTSIGDYQFKKAKTNTEIVEIETMYRAMTNEQQKRVMEYMKMVKEGLL